LVVLGLDLGISTTKAVAVDDTTFAGATRVTSTDPISSSAGAIGKIVEELRIDLSDIERVAVTGVGTAGIPRRILGIETASIDEIASIGYGGATLSDKDEALVVSVGTGTAMVAVDMSAETVRHVGGTALGGGTLFGLFRALTGKRDASSLEKMCQEGDLSRVDLTVGQLAGGPVGILPETATASNFGDITDDTTDADLTLALVNMVAQGIATTASFAARSENLVDDVVYVGGMMNVPTFRDRVASASKIFGATVVVPERSEYSTAYGAAIALQIIH
jgi:type II pantothenate kinase